MNVNTPAKPSTGPDTIRWQKKAGLALVASLLSLGGIMVVVVFEYILGFDERAILTILAETFFFPTFYLAYVLVLHFVRSWTTIHKYRPVLIGGTFLLGVLLAFILPLL